MAIQFANSEYVLVGSDLCSLLHVSARSYAPFFTFLLAFMAAMQGVVLSGNLIQLVVFWELTSLTSFLLIGYWHHRSDARCGARMALTVTAAGGLCLLLAMLLIGYVAGSWDVDQVLSSGDLIRNHPWYGVILLLFALGTFTKAPSFLFILVTSCHGRSYPSVGLFAFGHYGESGDFLINSAVASIVRYS